jgi:hypothetical protein
MTSGRESIELARGLQYSKDRESQLWKRTSWWESTELARGLQYSKDRESQLWKSLIYQNCHHIKLL